MKVSTLRVAVDSAVQLVHRKSQTEDKEILCGRVKRALNSDEEFPEKIQSILEKGYLICEGL